MHVLFACLIYTFQIEVSFSCSEFIVLIILFFFLLLLKQ